ncbi:MAG: glycosyltransferase family 4 protein [Candidatus Sulfopaludibacter sp.]|nr:glycosyltransferase family 4 protein [Candidatus Sulfopaludibacter sp.]
MGFPICGILHAANLPDLGWSYLRIALGLENCDALVATSLAGKAVVEQALSRITEWAAERFGLQKSRIELPRIRCIPLGTEVPEALMSGSQARSLLRIAEDAFVVLYLGRLTERYKADLGGLITAFAAVAKENSNACLLLAGQTTDASYVGYIKARLGMADLLHRSLILENFPEYMKSTILAACSVMVSPADCIQETFGLSLLEAMAQGKPVIASNWSGYRELVEDGKTGFLLRTSWSPEIAGIVSTFAPLLDPFEIAHRLAQATVVDCDALTAALKSLGEHPDLVRLMGERGRERVKEDFCWPRVARQYLELWKEQVETAEAPRTRRHPMHDYDAYFSHYAGQFVDDNSTIIVSTASEPDGHSIGGFGLSERRAQEIRGLLSFCGNRPKLVSEARRAGFLLHTVLWAAKQGIVQVCPPVGALLG